MHDFELPKLENGQDDTWWNRLMQLRDAYFCIEKHKADCVIMDEGSYRMFLKELDDHPNDALWFQNCCTIVVVPRIGKSEVVFYKALLVL